MLIAILALAMGVQAQTFTVPFTLPSGSGGDPTIQQPAKVIPLSPTEQAQRSVSKQAVDDAQAALTKAKADMQGVEEGIEHKHGVNSECGCYVGVGSWGVTYRDRDNVEWSADGQYMIVRKTKSVDGIQSMLLKEAW